MGDDELLDELAERIAEGPIVFTPDEDWVDKSSCSVKMIFEVILRAKVDFQIFNPVAITAEGLTSEPSRALLRHKNIHGKTKISKIEKDKDWVDESSRSLIIIFEVISRV